MTTLDELEEIRKRNLAKEEIGISAVNAVARMRSVLPGVGEAGSTPQTDEQNLGIASAMERSDRGNRFGFGSPQYEQNTDTPATSLAPAESEFITNVTNRRNQIMQGIDPDKPAIYPSGVRPRGGGPSRRDELNHELGQLTGILHQDSLMSAKTAHENLTKQRDIEISTQAKNVMEGLAQIPLDGSPESAARAQKLKKDNIQAWLHSPGVRDEFAIFAKTHDDVGIELTSPPGTKLKQVVRTSDGKSRAVFEPPTSKPSKAQAKAETDLADAGLTPEEFVNRKEIGFGTLAEAKLPKLKPGTRLGLWTNQYEGADKGDRMGIDIGGQTFSIPNDAYQRLNRVYPAKAATPTQPIAQAQPATAMVTQAALSPQDQTAITWAKANPKDARSAAILKLHGIQ